MNEPQVSVVVINFNGRHHLRGCFEALEAQEGVAFETILVDNASADGSVDFVRTHFPRVRVVALAENLGFAGGNNRGAEAARASTLVFLNNDTRVQPGWLAALVRALDARPGTAMVASRIVYMDDPRVLDSAGDAMTRAGGAFKIGHGAPADGYLHAKEVFGACGASFLIRRDVFVEAGGFDEDFFVCHEDVDLSYRVRLLGHACVYVPDSVVHHVGSATLGHRSDLSIFHGQRNLEWVYLKNTPVSLLVRTLPAHLVYVSAAAVYFLAMGKVTTFLRAKLAAARGLRRMWRKRAAIQNVRRASSADIWRQLEPRWLSVKVGEKRFDAREAGAP
ncbi:MAG: glycosyltransferase family 2 protein [Acidobacteriota bacterium]